MPETRQHIQGSGRGLDRATILRHTHLAASSLITDVLATLMITSELSRCPPPIPGGQLKVRSQDQGRTRKVRRSVSGPARASYTATDGGAIN